MEKTYGDLEGIEGAELTGLLDCDCVALKVAAKVPVPKHLLKLAQKGRRSETFHGSLSLQAYLMRNQDWHGICQVYQANY